jgi:alpha-beta hydrolase superfamily lysophospholipase
MTPTDSSSTSSTGRSATRSSTRTTTSADGTPIAYEVSGAGPALVLVDGAMCHREMGPSRGLAEQLSTDFTVHAYDRRDRGGSGAGASPWTVEREVEDLVAVIDAAGGTASVLGCSSGGVLALEAARRGAAIDRLVVYEAPFIVDDTHPANDLDLPERVSALVEQGRRGDAVRLFLRTVGAPAPVVALMRFLPPWRRMTAVAHTLAADLALVVPHEQGRPLPTGLYDAVTADTLVLAGGKSPTYMRNAQVAVAAALPSGRVDVLPGQTHMVKPRVLGPVASAFLGRHPVPGEL